MDHHQGIVFIPSGRYAVARTVYVKAGIRLFGYGATRPVFVLPENSPGFQKGMGVLFMFIGARPGGAYDPGARVPVPPPGTVPPKEVPDANSGTFYSARSPGVTAFGSSQHETSVKPARSSRSAVAVAVA